MDMLQNPVNFRDLGGLVGDQGRKLLPRRILRSGELVGLSDADRAVLTGRYHLRTVIDFRTLHEMEKGPDEIPEGVAYVHIDLLKDFYFDSSGLERIVRHDKPALIDMYMEKIYQSFVEEACIYRVYRQLIDILLVQEQGAVLFHCFAGKDRTGIAAAIILTLLGVDNNQIFEDYMKTNLHRREANAKMLEELRQKGIPQAQIDAVGIAMNVKASYLQKSFDCAKERFGSFMRYVVEGIGVSGDEIETLRAKYLES